MSHATRILYTTALSLTAAFSIATKAAPEEHTFASEQPVFDNRAATPQAESTVSGSRIDVSDFADKTPPSVQNQKVSSSQSATQIHPHNLGTQIGTASGGELASVIKQVTNGGAVSPQLLRSAQPTPANFQALKKAGLKTVINLRDGQEDIAYEKGIVEKVGMRYVSIPMSSFKPVQQAQIQYFLSVVSDPKNTPALVHCRQGEDRTGTVCAMYRMKKEGWTGPQAYKEMIAYGFHPELVMLDQAIVDASRSTAEPLTMPTFSDMTVDIKSRIGKFYNSLNTKRFSGFSTNF